MSPGATSSPRAPQKLPPLSASALNSAVDSELVLPGSPDAGDAPPPLLPRVTAWSNEQSTSLGSPKVRERKQQWFTGGSLASVMHVGAGHIDPMVGWVHSYLEKPIATRRYGNRYGPPSRYSIKVPSASETVYVERYRIRKLGPPGGFEAHRLEDRRKMPSLAAVRKVPSQALSLMSKAASLPFAPVRTHFEQGDEERGGGHAALLAPFAGAALSTGSAPPPAAVADGDSSSCVSSAAAEALKPFPSFDSADGEARRRSGSDDLFLTKAQTRVSRIHLLQKEKRRTAWRLARSDEQPYVSTGNTP